MTAKVEEVKPGSDPLPTEGQTMKSLFRKKDIIDRNQPAVVLADVLKSVGLTTAVTPTEELVGKTFIIQALKVFKGAFEGQDHCYFAICADIETGEIFNTTLGGSAVVEVLDALNAAGLNSPLVATLQQHMSVAGRKYYTLE
jgi:hypothetical protein